MREQNSVRIGRTTQSSVQKHYTSTEQSQDIASRPVRSEHCMYTRVNWRTSEQGERGVGPAFLKQESSIMDYAPCTTQRTELLLFSQKY
ncbi:hypothetical protein PUN28_014964 [Cardiocondyla obscurior]|uniref:Uncharacterized protein n=1 Tax=Cardiocondyla obscurior TaxID=286306 RepID=A0AAW2EYU8_9HYME